MKNLLLALAAVLISGCATTVPFTIQSVPAGVTKEQAQLDNLTCSNMSRTNGPWMYGIGTAIIRAEAAKRYQKCMTDKGYVVARGTGGPTPDFMKGVKIEDSSQHAKPTNAALIQPSHNASIQPATQEPAPADPALTQTSQRETTQTPAATQPTPTATRATNSAAPVSLTSRLEELKKLYGAGLITKKEYDEKRQALLATL